MKNAVKTNVRYAVKLFVLTLILTMMSFVGASAEDKMTGTGNFYYQRNGNIVTISNSGELTSEAGGTIFVACYDGEVLDCVKMIKADANIDPFYVREFTMKLSDDVENLKVRTFAWDSANSMKPLCAAKDISETPGDVIRAEGVVTATYKTSSACTAEQARIQIPGAEYSYLYTADISQVADIEKHIYELLDIDYIITEDDIMIVLGYSESDKNEYIRSNGDMFANISAGSLELFKSETSSYTVSYELADDVRMLVNGVEISDDISYWYEYLCNGDFVVIDTPKIGESLPDGKYDYIKAEFYGTAVVDEVIEMSSGIKRIAFEYHDYTQFGSRCYLEINPDDDEVEVLIVDTDGNEMTIDDIKANDVISIAYDCNAGYGSSGFYEVIVARNTVEGQVTGWYSKYGTDYYTVNGIDYKLVNWMYDELVLGYKYKLYLDKNGDIAKAEVTDTGVYYAIVDSFYYSSGDEKVRLVLADGTKADYTLAADNTSVTASNGSVMTLSEAMGIAAAYPLLSNGEIITETITGTQIATLDRFVKYYVNNAGEVTLQSVPANEIISTQAEYNSTSQRIGSYGISDTTKILDASVFAVNVSGDVDSVEKSQLIDEMTYVAVFIGGRNNADGTYPMVALLAGRVTESETEDDTDDNTDDDTTITPSEGYAIVDVSYYSAGDEKVRLVLENGTRADYILKRDNTDAEISQYIMRRYPLLSSGSIITSSIIDEQIATLDRFVKYSVNSSGEVTLESIPSDEIACAEAKYNSTSHRIGAHSISDSTTVLDASMFAPDTSKAVVPTSASRLEDGMEYIAVFMGERDADGAYPMAVLLTNNFGYTVNSRMVVATGNIGLIWDDYVEKYKIDIYTDTGEESIITTDLSVGANLREGDAFIYTTDIYGEVDDIQIIFSAGEYSEDNILGAVGEISSNVYFVGENSNTVKFYMYPVVETYSKGIDLAADMTASFTSSRYGEFFTYAEDAKAYQYDWAMRSGGRVSEIALSEVTPSAISMAGVYDDLTIEWTSAAHSPAYAVCREYDGDIQEIYSMYFY